MLQSELFEKIKKQQKIKPRTPQTTPRELDELGGLDYLKKLKSEGYTQRQASKALGVTTGFIYNYCKRRDTCWSDL